VSATNRGVLSTGADTIAGAKTFNSTVTTGANFVAAASGTIGFNGRSSIDSPANGNIRLGNNALNGFGLLQFGGVTAAEPAWKRSGTMLQARFADDSADAPISASAITDSGLTIGRIPYASTGGLLADSANHFWDNTNSRLGVGTATPLTKLNVVDTISTSPRGILSSQFSTDTSGARVGFSKARGTEASPTTIVTGDTLGRLMFRGYDGSNFLEMVSIEAVSTGTIAATRVPTYLAFSTATDATPSVLTERVRITTGTTLTAVAATDIPLSINLAASQSANAINVTGSGESAGSRFRVLANGDTYVGPGSAGSSIVLTTDPTTGPNIMFTQSFGGSVILDGYIFSPTLKMNSSFIQKWYSTTDLGTSGGNVYDIGLARNVAGVLEVNNSTAISAAGANAADLMANAIRGASVAGTNIAGKDLKVIAGLATGNAATGVINFQTSDAGSTGTTVQTPTTKFAVNATGVAVGGGTTVTKILSATATLDFGSTAAGAVADLTITVTGAAVGDVVALAIPTAAITTTGAYDKWVSAADTVTVRFIHAHPSNAEDPGSGSFRAMVTHF
jgi:hypothetical protein